MRRAAHTPFGLVLDLNGSGFARSRCRSSGLRATPLDADRRRDLGVKRVAVFGNAGGGKSTLARRLADLTGLPLYAIDALQFRAGGGEVPHDEYLKIHADLLRRDEWILDGYGSVATAWERFAVADTLIYIDLPLLTHYRWVTKRLVKGVFVNPEGWPENSPMWSSTMSSYRVVWRCHRGLTPRYRRLVAEAAPVKRVHHLRSAREMKAFLRAVEEERSAGR